MSLFPAEADTGRRGEAVAAARPAAAPGLVYSYEHQVRVTPMRGMVAGAGDARTRSRRRLPRLLREDVFARELCAGLDEVLAPVLLSLDSFAAYLDPGTTPEDMLGWLARWLGVSSTRSRAGGQRELIGRRVSCTAAAAPAAGSRWPSRPRSAARRGHRVRRNRLVESAGRRAARRRVPESSWSLRPGAGRVRRAAPRRAGRAVKPAHIPHRSRSSPSSRTGSLTQAPAPMPGQCPARSPSGGRRDPGWARRCRVRPGAPWSRRCRRRWCRQVGEQRQAGSW